MDLTIYGRFFTVVDSVVVVLTPGSVLFGSAGFTSVLFVVVVVSVDGGGAGAACGAGSGAITVCVVGGVC